MRGGGGEGGGGGRGERGGGGGGGRGERGGIDYTCTCNYILFLTTLFSFSSISSEVSFLLSGVLRRRRSQ